MQNPRPPIVSVLGHVDHGKTSLLDAIRKTSVASREAGGITQSIGASKVITKDKKEITFIDTPGHAAFSQMRSRGAKVADIAILVVAADDGPKPQTLEALQHIREAQVPMIVALTKIDMPAASIETAQAALEAQGVFFEGRGGDIPFVGVSSKTGDGIDQLLDLIILISEVSEFKGDTDAPVEAVVIETAKDKRGQLASVIVRNGKLKVTDEIIADKVRTKIKGIFDENGKPVKEILPGNAGQILGFTDTPTVGASVEIFDENKNYQLNQTAKTGPKEVKEGELGIFIKTKTAGSLEALISSLPPKIIVVGSSVGDVTESDILFAKSADADIYCFEAKIPSTVSKLADTEGVDVKTFSIIYELIQSLEQRIKGTEEVISGRAEVLATFPFENKKVAGSKVLAGMMKRGDTLKVLRGEKELGTVKIVSMRKIKNEVNEAKAGEELGILFEPQLDFEVGDVLVSIG